MLRLLRAARAARQAREFLAAAKDPGGSYRLNEWPDVRRASGAWRTRDAGPDVVLLRFVQRLTTGFLDPVDDSIFLTAGLRRMGIPASFHLGRELAPARPPAGYFAWVQHGDEVVSTSLPVRGEYIEIHKAVA